MAIDLNKEHYNEGEKIRTVTPENPAEEIYPNRKETVSGQAGVSGQIPAPNSGEVNAPNAGGQTVNSAEIFGKELENFGRKIGSAVEDLINNLGDSAAAARAQQQNQQNVQQNQYAQPQQPYTQQPQPAPMQQGGYQPEQERYAQQAAVQTEPQRDMRHFEVGGANQYPAPAGNGGFVTGVPAAPKKKKKKNIALTVIVMCVALSIISNVGNGIADKIRDGVIDSGIVASEEIGESSGSFEIPAAGINDLKIASGNSKIKLVPTDGGSFKVNYKLGNKQELLYSSNNGTIDIYTEGKSGFDLFGDNSGTITVYVPSEYSGNISASGSNGSVSVSDISTSGSVYCKSDNGTIDLENVNSSSLELKSGNGRVEMDNVGVTGSVKAESDNGKIYADGCTYSSGADLSSQNGKIELRHSTVSGSTTIRSDNGRCVFDGCSLENADIRSKNGSIKGSLKGSISDYSIEVSAKNGSSNLENRTGGKYTLSLSSDNGSIDLDFDS